MQDQPQALAAPRREEPWIIKTIDWSTLLLYLHAASRPLLEHLLPLALAPLWQKLILHRPYFNVAWPSECRSVTARASIQPQAADHNGRSLWHVGPVGFFMGRKINEHAFLQSRTQQTHAAWLAKSRSCIRTSICWRVYASRLPAMSMSPSTQNWISSLYMLF